MAVRTIALKDASVALGHIVNVAAAKRGLLSAAQKFVQRLQTTYIPGSGLNRYRGIYAASWQAKATDNGAIVFSTAPHAPLIEYGVRPGVKIGRKLIDALYEWISKMGIANKYVMGKGYKWRKHRATDTEKRSLAWAIAKSIQERGLWQPSGKRILEKATAELPAIVRAEVLAELAKGGGK